jgi:hypothetical protein
VTPASPTAQPTAGPGSEVAVSAAPAIPASAAPATTASSSAPAIDPACAGVPEWVEATNGRLDELQDLAAEAVRIAGLYDLAGYLAAIEDFSSAAQAAALDQAASAVPKAASPANDQALATYGAMIDAASLYIHYYTVEMTPQAYGLADAAYEQASRMAGDTRRELGRLTAMCEGP